MKNDKQRVIVRGINSDWFSENFIDMKVYFGGDPRGVPAQDADFIGFYLEAPASAITHLGIVDYVEKVENKDGKGKLYHLKAIVRLANPIKTEDAHAIRKHEYWTLEKLGVKNLVFMINETDANG